MAIDREDIEKIIAGVVGLGIAASLESVIDGGKPFVPSYDSNSGGSTSESDDDDDDEYYEASTIPTVNEIFEEDRIQREMDSMWDDRQAVQMWEEYQNGGFQQRDTTRDFQTAQQEFFVSIFIDCYKTSGSGDEKDKIKLTKKTK